AARELKICKDTRYTTMPNRSIPLNQHQCLAASSADDLAREIESKIGGRLTSSYVRQRQGDVRANPYLFPSGASLWSRGSTAPLTVSFPEDSYIRMQIQLRGKGVTRIGGNNFAVDETYACISPAQSTLNHGAGFQQLFWRVPCVAMMRKLAALIGCAGAG